VLLAFGLAVDQDNHVVGYYTLSAYIVRAAELSPDLAKKLSKYPLIPATLIGRLAARGRNRDFGIHQLE
jgi:hypothetical protein